MITVNYDRNGDTHTLEVRGHARYADKGDDIVCAGVSAIVYALLGWLENKYVNEADINLDDDKGEIKIVCDGGEDIATVFYMTAIGLEQIAMTYPAHVETNIVGIDD